MPSPFSSQRLPLLIALAWSAAGAHAIRCTSSRRSQLRLATVAAAAAASNTLSAPSFAAQQTQLNTVLVAGATGQTGRRVLERLASKERLTVLGGVRDVDKAAKSLSEQSLVLRGAMVQKVGAVDASQVALKPLDVEKDGVSKLKDTLGGVDALVIATGFVPGNPFQMNAAAHSVDNLGTVALVDAAKAAGVKKVVLVSSILTNGRSWGQEKSPGFVVTNAFGNVLDEKLVAEKYLRQSGIDYTIVRPGGLKSTPPSGALVVSEEDTLNSGEISRDLVADVCVAALSDPNAKNKVVEIFESTDPAATMPPQGKWFYGLKM